jgi:hypothetical protein
MTNIKIIISEHEMESLLKSNESPAWALDSDHKACYKCESAFTITNRRHHCRHWFVCLNNMPFVRLIFAFFFSSSLSLFFSP